MTQPRGTAHTTLQPLRWTACLPLVLVCALITMMTTTGCRPDWAVFLPPPTDSEGEPPAADAGASEVCQPHPAKTPEQRCVPAGSSNSSNAGLPPCEQWVKVAPEGATCGNGSPYKFFVNYSNKSDNVVLMFEPGGACFDYESCTRSKLGAVNPNGIPDDHAQQRSAALNLLQRTGDNPSRDWNMVFVSYCTGDVHGGDRVATYPDPAGGPALTYRHVGAHNTQAVIDFVAKQFKDIPQLLVTGCSAGGTGATQSYALIREGLKGVQCSYLLDDSGPIFTSNGPSHTLHTASRAAWNLDPLLTRLENILHVPAGAITSDFGRLNTALAEHYPRDRFAVTAYQRDLNYSLYSYAVFTPGISLEEIQADWQLDLTDLKDQYESRANMGYFMPFFRSDNCSHCASIAPIGHDRETIQTKPWLGTEIGADNTNLRSFIVQLLDNTKPIARDYELDESDDFTKEQAAMCLPKS